MKVSLSEEAIAELVAAADWLIDDDAWAVAEGLHEEVGRALRRLTNRVSSGKQSGLFSR